jgi:hypothetical protein
VALEEGEARGEVDAAEHLLGLGILQRGDECVRLADEQHADQHRRQHDDDGDAEQHEGGQRLPVP